MCYIVPSGLPQRFFISKSSHTLNLSWYPPLFSQRNGIITGYNISCYGEDFQYSQKIAKNSKSFTNLKPFTNYTCSVRAATIKGEGPAAVESVVTNEEGIVMITKHFIVIFNLNLAVPGPPEAFIGFSSSSKSITLSWKAPIDPNGVITNYTLQCFATGTGKTHQLGLMSSQTTATLSGLLPNTNYTCSITAHTSVGGGPARHISVLSNEGS